MTAAKRQQREAREHSSSHSATIAHGRVPEARRGLRRRLLLRSRVTMLDVMNTKSPGLRMDAEEPARDAPWKREREPKTRR